MSLSPQKIKVCLVDDHILLRDALAGALNSFDELEVVQVAANGKEFIEKLPSHAVPDIIILDVGMPEMDGNETAHWIATHQPQIRILILTMYDTKSQIHLLKKGAKGILKKDIGPGELKKAIQSIMTDGIYRSPAITGQLFNLMQGHGTKNSAWNKVILNDTELTFLKLVASEKTYKEIAGEMNVSPRTIDNYRDALFLKLEVKSRIGLAAYAIRSGIASMNN